MLGPRLWFSRVGAVPALLLFVILKALVNSLVFTLFSPLFVVVVVVVGVAANRVNSSSTIFTFKTEVASTNFDN